MAGVLFVGILYFSHQTANRGNPSDDPTEAGLSKDGTNEVAHSTWNFSPQRFFDEDHQNRVGDDDTHRLFDRRAIKRRAEIKEKLGYKLRAGGSIA